MDLLCSDASEKCVLAVAERVADAVTHARFVGTDQASDGVVLMKILQVNLKLMLIANILYVGKAVKEEYTNYNTIF